ncbi:hypothetical protein [Hymenobacter lucidus]|uniref:Uncharacterized protein n=1 Tax=Hymenobacter lucidus TaxID=2880930 RepID=A0ABS8AYT6_9BACT|nr:hypothetical protein [Hymenobacter lucidus]MCB2410970.1 hypothetical protein [Hymenobacter lucidus]
MSKKDYIAYTVFSMVAMCCYFAGKEAFGFLGGIFGMALGVFAGFAALRLVTRRSLRFAAYTMGIVTVVGMLTLFGLVRLSDRAVTVANLQGRWVADDPGGLVTLDIRDSTVVLDMQVFATPHRFALVVAHDSLHMTSPTSRPFAWRVHSLTTTRMNISAKQGVLDFQREDN